MKVTTEYDRTKWQHALHCANNRWSGTLFIGTQAGCAVAAKDCELPRHQTYTHGLNKGQYMLASTGKVSRKLLMAQLHGVAQVFN